MVAVVAIFKALIVVIVVMQRQQQIARFFFIAVGVATSEGFKGGVGSGKFKGI